jgi:hypothetical protein
VSLQDPAPGKYVIDIDPFTPPPGGTTVDYRLDYYDVDAAATLGNLAANPNPVPVQNTAQTSYAATWSGLDPDSRYLGYFEYDGALTPTYLYVDTSS